MDNNKLQYHIHLRQGDVGRYVLLPGDPGRSEKISRYLDDSKFVAQNREYTTYTGKLLGESVSVVSTGIGCPSTAIAVEELIKIGADTFIRIGTSGAMQTYIDTGDIAIVTGAIRDEGTTIHYMPVEFPAIANLEVANALIQGAKGENIPYHVGISHSKDSFFGELEPSRMPVEKRLKERWYAWVSGGAICSEMESAAIFIISSIHKKRAGGVMLMFGHNEPIPNPEEEVDENSLFNVDRVIKVAIAGLKTLIINDRL